MNKVFVLGVGAQKCGTSWLFDYINKSNNANFGITKEYHVWDALTVDICKEFKTSINNFDKSEKIYQTRWKMQNIDTYYENYFYKILQEGYTITGDITPSYSMLKANVFLDIKQRLSNLNVRVKVIFLMRDPVERIISHLKMLRRFDNKHHSTSFEKHLLSFYHTPDAKQRTLYESSIRELLKVFERNDCFFQIYERMFEPKEIISLSNFLDIEHDINFKNKIVNPSHAQNFNVSRETKQIIASEYANTYKFVEELGYNIKNVWANYNLTKINDNLSI